MSKEGVFIGVSLVFAFIFYVAFILFMRIYCGPMM